MANRSTSDHPPARTRTALRGLAVGLVWLGAATVGVPWIIRRAHGGGLPLISGLIEGRDRFPAEHYIAIWNRAVLPLTALLVGLTVGVALLYRFRSRITRASDRLLRRPPTVEWRGVLLMAVVFGLLAGLGEGLIATARVVLSGDPEEAPGPEILWLAPMAAGLAITIMALPVALLAGRRGLSLRVLSTAFATLTVYTAASDPGLGIHQYAAAILGLGAATLIGQTITQHDRLFWRFSRRFAVGVPALLVTAMIVTLVAPRWREQRMLGKLDDAEENSPNVLFLILDTVRAASMSLYGYDRETTPEIARFAATGTTFDRAISPAPWTLPAHASLFTGRLTHELSTDFNRSLDESWPTLAEVLSERGYATAGFVANLIYTTSETGLSRGFAVYRDRPISLERLTASSRWMRTPLERVRVALGTHTELVRKSAEDVNEEFLDWIDRRPDRPFFAFLNYFDAHAPYETHPPFDRKFTEHAPRYWLTQGWQREYTDSELQEVIDSYDSVLAYLDHEVGRLLDELRDRGVLDNTVVVIASDHGEHLGDHGMLSHANSLYMPLLHVPLVIAYPPLVPAGRRIATTAGLNDVAATVLDLLNLDETEYLHGRTLKRLWASASMPGDAGTVDVGVVSELTPNVFAHQSDPTRRGHMSSLVRGNTHYIRNGDGVEEMYDIDADPLEEQDLRPTPGSTAELSRLRAALTSIRRTRTPVTDKIRH